LLLGGVDYYQVVFTLPSELSRLALSNRQTMADLLFGAAWKSLRKTIRQEQDYEPAAIMVLHSWNQHLDAHWHVHALVPGAGPGIKQSGWKVSRAPAEAANSDDHYLVDATSLRETYRKRAIAHLNRLRNRGQLRLEGEFADLKEDAAWDSFTAKLASTDWVSYIQPPPCESSEPNHVVRYLTRYLTGGPISDARITAADENSVTFMAREGKTPGGEEIQVPVTLPTVEFVRRWCLHIQSDQLTKTRYYGGWSNTKKENYLDRCVRQTEAAGVAIADDADEFPPSPSNDFCGERADERDLLTCPRCEQPLLRLVNEWAKPSWKELFWRESETCPGWYADSLRAEHRRFWTAAYDEDFYDWYLETQVESAKDPDREPPPVQLFLAGLHAGSSYELESF
jgi:hypothetical protein